MTNVQSMFMCTVCATVLFFSHSANIISGETKNYIMNKRSEGYHTGSVLQLRNHLINE